MLNFQAYIFLELLTRTIKLSEIDLVYWINNLSA